ncbi:glycine N-methyltransferase [Folsomia candida]|uniref:Glycine N-methyltransferase n=1 Tax=Folsomia candida TaxID=158441 RepID=A0A226EMV5_FOLCA|nr:glycine N-methyltransferase [Folsomia candida]OXA59005.1 Glycine N-methyltransferase [Folsomia candida]
MVDSVYRTRSLGIAAEGIPDQYADGRAAKLWEIYVGDKNSRTDLYKHFLINLLREKKCRNIIDVACGTGIDSVMLVEEGFNVTSVDASDKMLKYALRTRWNRRKEPAFDKWVIEEANWLTLPQDLDASGILSERSNNANVGDYVVKDGFDVAIALGNSFAHLPDFIGDQRDQRQAIANFAKVLKPGGMLIIDHRNYDYILDYGKTRSTNIYYNSQCVSNIHTSVLWKESKPSLVTLDYELEVPADFDNREMFVADRRNHFRLSYYPHRLESFSALLKEAFGPGVKHQVFGDFMPLDKTKDPAFFIHVIQKP